MPSVQNGAPTGVNSLPASVAYTSVPDVDLLPTAKHAQSDKPTASDSDNVTDAERCIACCRRGTKLEKCLIATILIVILGVVIVTVAVARNSSRSMTSSTPGVASSSSLTSAAGGQVCLTVDCIKAAGRMLSAMDPAVDRCADFYDYACGTANRMNIIPNDKASYDVIYRLTDTIQTQLKALFDEQVSESEPQAVRNVKLLYRSCLNTELIEQRGDEPLRTLLADLGGWPLLDNTEGSASKSVTHDFVALLAKLRLANNRAIVNVWVSSDDKNSTVNTLHLDQPKLGLPSRDYFLKGEQEKAFVAYRNMAYNLAVALGANRSDLRSDVNDMVDFEVQLAHLTVPDEKRRDGQALYQPYTIRQVYDNLTDAVDWLRFLRLLMQTVNIDVNMNEPVVVYAPSYILQLGQLLLRTPRRTLVNYAIWQMVMSRIIFLPQRFAELWSELKQALTGADQDSNRWKTCANFVHENFGMAVGRMFVTKHFDERAKANALSMIDDIRAAFIELLDEVSWLDDKTRSVAREKAAAMTENIGYPDYILNNTALDKDYEDVKIESDKYFENVLNILHISTQVQLRQLRQPVDKTRWSSAPAVVNAYYSNTKNKIMFPAGILQPPFYHENYPNFLNYGGIGMVIGHEITHGFDDMGRQLDKDGNLKQWWTDDVINTFKSRAQCIIDKYSNFTVAEVNLNLNGLRTQGENIADNGGLKQAFRAYRRWVERQGAEEPVLPGLNMTSNQLFFLNFAQIWCGTARPESYIQYIRTNLHSPGRFRVIGTLSNSVDFAEAFNCRPNSAMNPVDKCHVW